MKTIDTLLPAKPKAKDVEAMIRYHRRMVGYVEDNSFMQTCHTRAIKRLKQTSAFKAVCSNRRDSKGDMYLNSYA